MVDSKLQAIDRVHKSQVLRQGALWEPGSAPGFKAGVDSEGDNPQCRYWSTEGELVLLNHPILDLISMLSSWGAPSIQQYNEHRRKRQQYPLPLYLSCPTGITHRSTVAGITWWLWHLLCGSSLRVCDCRCAHMCLGVVFWTYFLYF